MKGLAVEPIFRWKAVDSLSEERIKLRSLFPDIDWIFTDLSVPDFEKAEKPELESFVDRYCDLVKENRPDIIFSSIFDIGALIHSYIAHKNNYLKAPSVESVILCNSKGYTRKLIIPEDHNIKYKIIPFSAGTDIDVDEIVDSVGFPLILKPACGWESNLIQKCDNKVQLIEAVEKITGPGVDLRSYHDVWGKILVGLEEKYELLETAFLLAEECIGVEAGDASVHTVEVCIQEGRVVQCEFVDNLYWEKNPQVFLGCSVPSQLPESVQLEAFKMREKVAQRLIGYGMDNCFFNIEIFAMKDGSVKVMEINPRLSFSYLDLMKMMCNVDKLRSLFYIQLGKEISPPKFLYVDDVDAPRHCVNFYLNSHETGKASDIFNYDHLDLLIGQNNPYITFNLLINKYQEIKLCTVSGINFCYVNICGKDFNDCKQKFKPIYHKLFINSEKLGLWQDGDSSSDNKGAK